MSFTVVAPKGTYNEKAHVGVHRGDEAMRLFQPYLPCPEAQLRRAYLKLALQYHPDKWAVEQKKDATELFQAIAAVYEKLMRPLGARMMKRVKSPVSAAAELGDMIELGRLLAERPEQANEQDEVGATPLMFAAKGGSVAAAQLLVSYGADVNAQTPIGWSVLVWAALSDQDAMVQFLVRCGASVTDNELILVSFAGNAKSLKVLLESFPGSAAHIRSDTNGQTLMHLVCFGMVNFPRDTPQRYLACIDPLLEHGVPVDAKDQKGRTPLRIYAGHGNWLQCTYEQSATHMQMVEKLCESGANPLEKDALGNSPLSLAGSAGLRGVKDLLSRFVQQFSNL